MIHSLEPSWLVFPSIPSNKTAGLFNVLLENVTIMAEQGGLDLVRRFLQGAPLPKTSLA